MSFLNELNDSQRKAVKAEGVVMIIAGPGTGKTKTLTTRIQYLIQEKSVHPSEILALTFTKKAATEMKERLSHLNNTPYISTFHALALDQLGNSNKIISEPERLELLQFLVEQDNKHATKKDIKDISLMITNHKNTLDTEKNVLVEQYNALLQERNLIDYDDLIIQLHSLAKEGKVTNKFNYILVDEFQDTNMLQYEILKLLMNNNLFVIGDPLQSIYSFRGSTAHIFKKLEEDFPGNTKIQLSINYRSDKSIVKVSSELFPNNSQLEPFSQEEGTVNIINTINEYTEAEWIVKRIDTLIGGTDLIRAGENTEKQIQKRCFKDFAVIYRTHSFARVLEHIFVTSGIPYQIVGDNILYDRPEIKFIITCLKYFHHNSAEYLYKLLNLSIFGLSFFTKKQLKNLYKNNSNNFVQELENNIDLYCDKKQDMNVVSTFMDEVKNVKNEFKNSDISEIIHKIAETKVVSDYINSKALNQNNIHMLISMLTQFDKRENSLQKAIEYIHYLEEHEFYDPRVDKVTLMSIHAAKGLEFSEVFIVGFEQGSIPYLKKEVEESREEEKRLLYVALTRAKNNLYLLKTQERFKEKMHISEFAALLQSIRYIEDEAIEKRNKKISKLKDKKSQLELF